MSLHIGIPLFIAASLIQAAVLPEFRVFGGQPDLVVVIVMAWAMLDGGVEALGWAFVGGLLLDLFSGATIGLSTLALLPVAYTISLTESRLTRNNLILPALIAGAGALGYHVIYVLALRFLGDHPVDIGTALWYSTLPSILFDMIIVVPVIRILSIWYDRLHPRVMRRV